MTSYIDRLAISAAVDAASLAVSGGVMPILNNLHITNIGNRAYIWGSDLDLEISVNIEMQGDPLEYINVEAKKLKALLSKAPKASMVRIDMSRHQEAAKFGFGAASYILPGVDMAEGQKTADAMKVSAPKSNLFTIPGDDLKTALERVAMAISTDSTRYYLNGVFIHDRGNDLAFVATDGSRLHRQVIDKPDDYPVVKSVSEDSNGKEIETIERGVIVPQVTINAMLKLLGKRPPAEVDMRVDATRIEFAFPCEFGTITVRSKLIDGTFPDYERVVPTYNDKKITVDRATFVDAIKAVAIVLGSDKGMLFSFGPTGNLISARNRDDGATAQFPLELITALDGEFEIGLNYVYLLESLKCFGTPITIAFNDAGSPAVFSSDMQAGFTTVQMPMRV